MGVRLQLNVVEDIGTPWLRFVYNVEGDYAVSLRVGRLIQDMQNFTTALGDHADPDTVPSILVNTNKAITAISQYYAAHSALVPELVRRAKDVYAPLLDYANRVFSHPSAPLAQMVSLFKGLSGFESARSCPFGRYCPDERV
jgi:hypothetical protein